MTGNKFAALAGQLQQPQEGGEEKPTPPDPQPAPPKPAEAPPAPAEDVRMLGARVPDSIFREFSRQKSQAEEDLRVRKVTTEVGLEALVRALRRPEVWAAWLEEVQQVRQGHK